MPQLLRIIASPHGHATRGFELADEFASKLVAHGNWSIVDRNLNGNNLSPISRDYASAITSALPIDIPAYILSEELIRELERSDAVMVVTPIHNFTVPACLKLWIDYVVRARRTFTEGPGGKVGLLKDRPCIVVLSTGSRLTDETDFFTPYIRHVFKTIGIHDVRTVVLQRVFRASEEEIDFQRFRLGEIADLLVRASAVPHKSGMARVWR